MKQYWEKIATRVDAMSLRERVLIFAVATLLLITLVNSFLLDPQYAKQKRLSQRMTEDQAKASRIHAEIQARSRANTADPDAPNKERLKVLQQQSQQMNNALKDLQKRLVSPDKMAGLLDGILKRSGKLHLVSLKTLSPSSLSESVSPERNAAEGKASAPTGMAGDAVSKDKTEDQQPMAAVYKHGVELTIQGSYADLTSYLAELEALPWQLFWSKAKFSVDEYPRSTLTLTLYTLSLDKKWLDL